MIDKAEKAKKVLEDIGLIAKRKKSENEDREEDDEEKIVFEAPVTLSVCICLINSGLSICVGQA